MTNLLQSQLEDNPLIAILRRQDDSIMDMQGDKTKDCRKEQEVCRRHNNEHNNNNNDDNNEDAVDDAKKKATIPTFTSRTTESTTTTTLPNERIVPPSRTKAAATTTTTTTTVMEDLIASVDIQRDVIYRQGKKTKTNVHPPTRQQQEEEVMKLGGGSTMTRTRLISIKGISIYGWTLGQLQQLCHRYAIQYNYNYNYSYFSNKVGICELIVEYAIAVGVLPTTNSSSIAKPTSTTTAVSTTTTARRGLTEEPKVIPEREMLTTTMMTTTATVETKASDTIPTTKKRPREEETTTSSSLDTELVVPKPSTLPQVNNSSRVAAPVEITTPSIVVVNTTSSTAKNCNMMVPDSISQPENYDRKMEYNVEQSSRERKEEEAKATTTTTTKLDSNKEGDIIDVDGEKEQQATKAPSHSTVASFSTDHTTTTTTSSRSVTRMDDNSATTVLPAAKPDSSNKEGDIMDVDGEEQQATKAPSHSTVASFTTDHTTTTTTSLSSITRMEDNSATAVLLAAKPDSNNKEGDIMNVDGEKQGTEAPPHSTVASSTTDDTATTTTTTSLSSVTRMDDDPATAVLLAGKPDSNKDGDIMDVDGEEQATKAPSQSTEASFTTDHTTTTTTSLSSITRMDDDPATAALAAKPDSNKEGDIIDVDGEKEQATKAPSHSSVASFTTDDTTTTTTSSRCVTRMDDNSATTVLPAAKPDSSNKEGDIMDVDGEEQQATKAPSHSTVASFTTDHTTTTTSLSSITRMEDNSATAVLLAAKPDSNNKEGDIIDVDGEKQGTEAPPHSTVASFTTDQTTTTTSLSSITRLDGNSATGVPAAKPDSNKEGDIMDVDGEEQATKAPSHSTVASFTIDDTTTTTRLSSVTRMDDNPTTSVAAAKPDSNKEGDIICVDGEEHGTEAPPHSTVASFTSDHTTTTTRLSSVTRMDDNPATAVPADTHVLASSTTPTQANSGVTMYDLKALYTRDLTTKDNTESDDEKVSDKPIYKMKKIEEIPAAVLEAAHVAATSTTQINSGSLIDRLKAIHYPSYAKHTIDLTDDDDDEDDGWEGDIKADDDEVEEAATAAPRSTIRSLVTADTTPVSTAMIDHIPANIVQAAHISASSTTNVHSGSIVDGLKATRQAQHTIDLTEDVNEEEEDGDGDDDDGKGDDIKADKEDAAIEAPHSTVASLATTDTILASTTKIDDMPVTVMQAAHGSPSSTTQANSDSIIDASKATGCASKAHLIVDLTEDNTDDDGDYDKGGDIMAEEEEETTKGPQLTVVNASASDTTSAASASSSTTQVNSGTIIDRRLKAARCAAKAHRTIDLTEDNTDDDDTDDDDNDVEHDFDNAMEKTRNDSRPGMEKPSLGEMKATEGNATDTHIEDTDDIDIETTMLSERNSQAVVPDVTVTTAPTSPPPKTVNSETLANIDIQRDVIYDQNVRRVVGPEPTTTRLISIRGIDVSHNGDWGTPQLKRLCNRYGILGAARKNKAGLCELIVKKAISLGVPSTDSTRIAPQEVVPVHANEANSDTAATIKATGIPSKKTSCKHPSNIEGSTAVASIAAVSKSASTIPGRGEFDGQTPFAATAVASLPTSRHDVATRPVSPSSAGTSRTGDSLPFEDPEQQRVAPPVHRQLKAISSIVESPYQVDASAEVGEGVFEEMLQLLKPVCSSTGNCPGSDVAGCDETIDTAVSAESVKTFGGKLAKDLVQARTLIESSNVLYKSEWKNGTIHGRQFGFIPKPILLLCLPDRLLAPKTMAIEDKESDDDDEDGKVLRRIIVDLRVHSIVRAAMKAWSFEEMYENLSTCDDNFIFPSSNRSRLDRCAIFVARTYRCMFYLKWKSLTGTLLEKIHKCLGLMEENIRVTVVRPKKQEKVEESLVPLPVAETIAPDTSSATIRTNQEAEQQDQGPKNGDEAKQQKNDSDSPIMKDTTSNNEKRKRKEPTPLADRAYVRAGETQLCDHFGCSHLGIRQITTLGGMGLVKRIWKYYISEGRYLAGKFCDECKKPADSDERLKGVKPGGVVMYICDEGNKYHRGPYDPETEHLRCNFCICAVGCAAKRMEAMEKATGGGKRARTRVAKFGTK